MALRAGETEFRRLLEKLPACAYTCDADGRITYFNPHAVELWGRAPALNDPVDRFCGSFKLFSIDGSAIAHEQCWTALALRTEREYNGREIVIERPDGKRITALAHANPLRDESGRLIGAVNVLVDIGRFGHAEGTTSESDRAKDEFLAALAHELRDPLAPIRNALAILQLAAPALPEAQWAMSVIGRQMQQMSRLIDDLLDIARITCNRMELRTERIELSEVVHAAVEASRPLIEARGQELVVAAPNEPIHLYGDLVRLVRVLSNVLDGSARYTEPGGRICLRVSRQGGDVAVSVRDTGFGIPAETLPNIFEMFTRTGSAADRSVGGLGLGSTLVKRLVEMHGGSIAASSDGQGKGSEFTVRLPLALDHAPRSRRVGAESAALPNPSSLRILIVDDNPDSAASLAMLLRLSGNDARTAHDGFEAVEVAGSFQPEVAILDIGMPRMNGYDAARAIRDQPWGRNMVLIAVTGWGQDADRHRSLEAGFDRHLVKPVDPTKLLQLLASIVRHA